MRNLPIKFICIILVVITILVCIPMTAYSYETYDYSYYNDFDNIQLLQNQDQVYLVGTHNKNISIDGVYPNSFSISLELNNPVASYNLFNETFVFLCYNNNQTEVTLYDIDTDVITSFNVNRKCSFTNYSFAYSNGLVYLCDTDGDLYIYNTRGKLINTITLGTTTHSIICNYLGDVYAVSPKGLMYIGDDYFEYVSYSSFKVATRFVSNYDFIDYTGKMFRIIGNDVVQLTSRISDVCLPSGGIYKNFALITSKNKLYAVDITCDEIKREFSAEATIEQICMVDDVCVLFMYKYGNPALQIVEFKELKTIYQSDNNTDFIPQKENHTISSDVYNVDFENQRITGIPPKTTVAKFKQNMNYENFDVEFFRYDGRAIDSGNVGTATLVRFFTFDTTYEFELCIKGELTGEGNINSRDLQEMFDIILENIIITGVFVDACDMDDSGEIDLVDMVLINRAIEKN